MLNDVGIGRKRVRDDASSRMTCSLSAHDVTDDATPGNATGVGGASADERLHPLQLVVASASYPQLIPSRNNQETSLSARVLDRRAHNPVDQFFQNHLARDCLRDLDYGGQIQEFDRRHDRARRRRRLALPS